MALYFDVNDYFEISEESLESSVQTSFHALKAFTARLEGSLFSESDYVPSSDEAPSIVYYYLRLYRYALGTEPFSEFTDQYMSMAATFALMIEELEEGFESKMATGTGMMFAVIVQAYARYKIDHYVTGIDSTVMDCMSGMFEEEDTDGLSTLQLAFMARIKQQSVRNKLSSQTEFQLERNSKGKYFMKVSDAYRWLSMQVGFIRTAFSMLQEEETISVPVSKDGSFFRKNIRGPKGYRIGEKGSEVVIEEFNDALESLRKMPSPYWRRPSKTTGIPGIVTGIRWERKPLSEVLKA
ncbi:MAG: hypothetical protein Q8L20_03275 [Gammaproteobacteria bacterium]|nr:hypothetical protein [Gammaproteobacteria bacterium]